MAEQTTDQHFAGSQPDAFDRAYGQALGFPKTRESVVTVTQALGIGGVRQYTVQTFRVTQGAVQGDEVFIWINGPEGPSRIWLPAKVTAAQAAQRAALTAKVRSAIGKRGGKASQAKRKREGRPAFGGK